jgi:spore coat polysaccharide biosynthesis protein SpsF
MGSRRFPGKSLAEIEGRPILWYLFRQLGFVRGARAVLATSDVAADDALAEYGRGQGWAVFRGSEADVLARYHGAAAAHGARPETAIVRVTGDDIHPDPNLIEAALALHRAFAGGIAAVITDPDALPYGVYVQSCTFAALDRAHLEASDPADREHVFPYILRHPEQFPRLTIAPSQRIPGPALSIDTPDDLERNRRLLARLAAATPPYTTADLLAAAAP